MAVVYDLPTQNHIRAMMLKNIMDNREYHRQVQRWEPSYPAGSRFNGHPFVVGDQSARYPYLNDAQLREFNSKKSLKGGKVQTKSSQVDKLNMDVINALKKNFSSNELSGNGMSGKGLDYNKIKSTVLYAIKTYGPTVLDYALPALGGVVGTYFANPALGMMVGKIATIALKEFTGFGMKRKGRKRGGSCDCNRDEGYAEYKGEGMRKGQQSDRMRRRNILAKKLMQKNNMSLIQASKYIKDHNLKY